jgi:hypothetical protein
MPLSATGALSRVSRRYAIGGSLRFPVARVQVVGHALGFPVVELVAGDTVSRSSTFTRKTPWSAAQTPRRSFHQAALCAATGTITLEGRDPGRRRRPRSSPWAMMKRADKGWKYPSWSRAHTELAPRLKNCISKASAKFCRSCGWCPLQGLAVLHHGLHAVVATAPANFSLTFCGRTAPGWRANNPHTSR